MSLAVYFSHAPKRVSSSLSTAVKKVVSGYDLFVVQILQYPSQGRAPQRQPPSLCPTTVATGSNSSMSWCLRVSDFLIENRGEPYQRLGQPPSSADTIFAEGLAGAELSNIT